MPPVPLACPTYNEFLQGGVLPGMVTGIYGPAGSGKTFTGMLAALSPALADKKIMYIDTERGFSSERFVQLSPDADKRLKSMIFFLPKSFDDLCILSEKIAATPPKNLGLIIVDTVTFHYRYEVAKRREMKEINHQFVEATSRFSEIGKVLDIPVIFMSQVYADMKNSTITEDKVLPIGNFILKNRCKTMIEIEKKEGRMRNLILKNHPSIEKGKTLSVEVTALGFEKR